MSNEKLIESLHQAASESECPNQSIEFKAAEALAQADKEIESLRNQRLSRLDRECLRIGQEIQRAAGELPDLYEIEITIEKGSGTVDLIDPEGNREYIEHGGDGLSYSITDAIDAAVAAMPEGETK